MKSLLCRSSAILSISLFSVFSASNPSSASERWSGTCRVEFSGTSTFGGWSGTIDTEPFTVAVGKPDQIEVSPLATVISAQTDELKTSSERRDKVIKESMQSSDHPEISVRLAPDFTMAQTRPVRKSGFLHPTVIPFTVELLGKEYQMMAQVSNCRVENGVMCFGVSFPVSLKACGIKAPSVLGIIRVGDSISISAAVTLQMSAAIAAR
jgi:hypothetical protein